MTDETATEPEATEEVEQEVVAEETEAVEAQEPEEGEEAPVEMAEVEIDGETYQIPAALKDGVMKNADYTQKTQQLAEQRRAAEEHFGQEREAFVKNVQTQRENIALYGKLEHTEAQLEQLAQVDWTKLHQEDPDKAQEMGFYRESLRDQSDKIQDEIERREHESKVVAEREHATRKDQLETTLARDIPNYSPELRTEMQNTAIKAGFTEQDVSSLTDPRYFQILHLANLGAEVLKRQTATPKPKLVKPVSKVTGGKTPDTGPSDSQSVDAWMKRRNQQVSGG